MPGAKRFESSTRVAVWPTSVWPVVLVLVVLVLGDPQPDQATAGEDKNAAPAGHVERPVQNRAPQAADSDIRRLEFVAVNKTSGKPIPKVTVDLEYIVARTRNTQFRRLTCDGQGRAVWEYPGYAIFTFVRMNAKPSGFVPLHLRWDNNNGSPVTFPK